MKFETKCKKLGIEEEVKSIINNCECGEIKEARIIELSKLRKWEIIKELVNYYDYYTEDDVYDWDIGIHLSTILKKLDIPEDKVAEAYAEAICECGSEIAYAINEDVILTLE